MHRKFVLASHNQKKTLEIRDIIAPMGIELLNLADFPGAPIPEETGDTFRANAVIKAEAACAFTRLPCLADDSGLLVDALGGAPGVYSARFAGRHASDRDNNLLLLEKLAEIPDKRRTARFECVIAVAIPKGATRTFCGETRGRILTAPRGTGGFGYDPLFLSDELGLTFGEAPGELKNRISHRSRALAEFRDWMEGFLLA